MIVRSGCSTINCKRTRTAFPISYQVDNSMTAKTRKRIETIFPQLTDLFLVIRNYAKITNGLFARIIGKISALTILQYVNFINDKPIGRIKYALN